MHLPHHKLILMKMIFFCRGDLMKRKVAIYARVSTEHEAQLSVLDNQVQYYDEILKKKS